MAAPRQEPSNPTQPVNEMLEDRRARINKNKQMLAKLGVPQVVSRIEATQAVAPTHRAGEGSHASTREAPSQQPPASQRAGGSAKGGNSNAAAGTRARSTRSSAVKAQQRLKAQAAAEAAGSKKRKHAADDDFSGSESSGTEPSDDDDDEVDDDEDDVEMVEDSEESAGEDLEPDLPVGTARAGRASGGGKTRSAAKKQQAPGQSSRRQRASQGTLMMVDSGAEEDSDAEEERELQLAIAASLQEGVQGSGAAAAASELEHKGTQQGPGTQAAATVGGRRKGSNGRGAGAAGGGGGRGGKRGGRGGRPALELTEADVLKLFDELRSETRGVVTRKKLLAVTARLGLDYDEERVNQMLEFAASVVGESDFMGSTSNGAGPSSNKQRSEALNFEGFQLLVAALLGAQ